MLIYSQVAKYTKHLDKMWQTLYCKWWTLHAKDTRLHNIYKPYQYWCQWTKGVFNVPSLFFQTGRIKVFESVASVKPCPSVHSCVVTKDIKVEQDGSPVRGKPLEFGQDFLTSRLQKLKNCWCFEWNPNFFTFSGFFSHETDRSSITINKTDHTLHSL